MEDEEINTPKYKEGVRDGRAGTYNPPHSKGLRTTVLGRKDTEEEKQERDDYKQGHRHGQEGN